MVAINIDLDDLVSRYESGQSVNSLAKFHNVSRRAIMRRLVLRGVTLRNQSQSEAAKWSLMTEAQRANQVRKAHDAVRGKRRSDAEMELRAAVKSRRIGAGETELIELLSARGIHPEGQRPVGRYNIDIACGDVAVEIHRTSGHPMKIARIRDRVENLFSRGYVSLYVWLRPWEFPTDVTADHVVSLLQLFSRSPTEFGKYRVIRADGYDQTTPGGKRHHVA
jgi:very-short-patch-repair endonuclease